MNLIERVVKTSIAVGSTNRDATFRSLIEEVGELATEIAIEAGTKDREPSPDGVSGEAIDVLVVILDLLHQQFGDKIHTQEFLDRVQIKLDKWEKKSVLRD
jgi:NTP pyrophosphatase (non-canonical NTP hydrolase)